jgi:hypothetical protein
MMARFVTLWLQSHSSLACRFRHPLLVLKHSPLPTPAGGPPQKNHRNPPIGGDEKVKEKKVCHKPRHSGTGPF